MQKLSMIESAANVSRDYQKTLALLRALKAGAVSLDNVTMTAEGWTVAESEPSAELPEPPEDVA